MNFVEEGEDNSEGRQLGGKSILIMGCRTRKSLIFTSLMTKTLDKWFHFSDLAAAASGHGGHYCEDGVPTEAALLAILAAFAVSFALLYMASTTNTGRKKREISISDMLKDVMWSGRLLPMIP